MKVTNATPDALLLRVADACALTQISRTKAYELIASGAWPTLKIGRSLRIPRAGLIQWIERTQQQTRGTDQ